MPKKKKGEEERLIWTRAYSPFIMGGDVNAPIGTKMKCSVIFFEKSINGVNKLLVAESPDTKRIVVAEYTTGAIVGNDVTVVMEDIKQSSRKIIKEQIEDANKLLKKVHTVSFDEFWRRYPKKR